MIESVFGIVHSSKNYFLTQQQFEFAIKYILDTKYGIDPRLFEMRINYIQNETVFVFDVEYRNCVYKRIIDELFSFNNENKLKKALLKDIFDTENVSEKVIYSELSNFRVKGILFTVIDNTELLDSPAQTMRILDCPQVDMLNAQIKVLSKKKIDIIKNNKR